MARITQPSSSFRLIKAAGSVLDGLGLVRVRLEVDPLLRVATRRTGLTDFGDPGFLEGLRTLLTSLEEDAGLHPIGRLSLRELVVDSLVNRLLLTEAQKRTPEIFTQPLIPPLIVLGLPRTGTTFLHRLLAEDPAHHALGYWESASPLPLPGRRDDRFQRTKRKIKSRKLLVPGFDQKHFVAADIPDEDLYMLGATFDAWYFWKAASVYGYLDWYLAQDHERKYREHRAWLQVLQAAHLGHRLVLKSPEHTGALPALLRAVPEARLVQLHRDPATMFASYLSLMLTLQGHSTDTLDVGRNTAAHLHHLTEEARRNLSARDVHPGAVLDIRYDDLVANPEGVVELIYDHYGLELTSVYQENLRRYVENNPQGKHGPHRYSTEEFGLDEEEVRTHFVPYNERFDFATD